MPLAQEHCPAVVAKLTPTETQALLAELRDWNVEAGKLVKTFRFGNYYETLAFVNASAFISHREDHHPELHVSYNACRVAYDTHSVDGLSRNDFVCAAKLDALT
ncbi:4a-hydroxytetrahydrobiopterin dehydratase [Chitinimonas arctica]|uniref:Putative pterin-4-alpha-carbinolamine dehydratase n=1 Tax=Chitinimonas arctica TaxID=2594795 RepID=A0A516SJM6_9NEIS|nr:4a-hydroxytetrahydrobiopterin dehydratase [Chitinimonas arctica]QDQ28350.1 4a-hydroxytetrahydrobiopterin dehydratase [Chitinimonas arctica]